MYLGKYFIFYIKNHLLHLAAYVTSTDQTFKVPRRKRKAFTIYNVKDYLRTGKSILC
jgi:hypothetical protein